MLSEWQSPRWRHACYGMFGSGLILTGDARYISVTLVIFWSILTHTKYVFVVFLYLDVRDDTIIMSNKTSMINTGTCSLSAATAHPRPRMRRAARATNPEYTLSQYRRARKWYTTKRVTVPPAAACRMRKKLLRSHAGFFCIVFLFNYSNKMFHKKFFSAQATYTTSSVYTIVVGSTRYRKRHNIFRTPPVLLQP